MEISKEFWAGKRVFITGHTGFKGGWLCLWLEQLGAEITGYALDPPTSPSLFEVAQIAQGMNSVIGDISNVASLETAMRVAAPEIVIHIMQSNRVSVVFNFFAETVCQTSKASHAHTHCQILPFDKAGRNVTP